MPVPSRSEMNLAVEQVALKRGRKVSAWNRKLSIRLTRYVVRVGALALGSLVIAALCIAAEFPAWVTIGLCIAFVVATIAEMTK